MVFSQLEANRLIKLFILMHIVGIKCTTFKVKRNKVLLESFHTYLLVFHQMTENQSYIFC